MILQERFFKNIHEIIDFTFKATAVKETVVYNTGVVC